MLSRACVFVRKGTTFLPRVACPKRTYSVDWWSSVKQGPEDPILGVTVAFNKDTDPRKINLGVGAYRDDNGKPFILPVVRKTEEELAKKNLDHEYAPIGGLEDFNKAAISLAYGPNSAPIKENKIAAIQCLSGTGSLRVIADFFGRFLPQKPIYMPIPTWGNHRPIFEDARVPVKEYRYYNPKTGGLDFEGTAEDIKKAPAKSIILFHACAHNPTGVDPSLDQWQKLSQICKEREHFVLFDLAYQGFASGDPDKDAAAVRTFVDDGHKVALCQSFAKNFGLYGERIGALSLVVKDAEEKDRIISQLKILVRPMYSNPPVYGARLVATILKDQTLAQEWRRDVKLMADRIIGVRKLLVENLKKAGSTRDWSRITNQIGMFCYSGLTPEQVDALAQKHHIYLTRNGRISMAGVTTKNVKYLADSMHEVSK